MEGFRPQAAGVQRGCASCPLKENWKWKVFLTHHPLAHRVCRGFIGIPRGSATGFENHMPNVQLEKDGKNIIFMMDFYLELTKYVCQIVLLDSCCYRNHMQVD